MAVTSKKKKAIDTNDSGISQTLGENCSLIKFIFLIINKEQNVRVYIKITMPLYVLMVTTKGNRNNGHTSPRTSSPYQPPRLSEWLIQKIWTFPIIPDYLLLEEKRQLCISAERASIQYGPFSYQKKKRSFINTCQKSNRLRDNG